MELNQDTLRFIRYISFKLDCLRYQEENPLTLDVEAAQEHFDTLSTIIEEKTEALAKVMPKVPDQVKRKPKNCYKKDGTYSKLGKEWFDLLRDLNLPESTEGEVVVTYKEGNPQSTPQIKEWLNSLGWEPCHFKYTRNKITGEEKKIPQVRYSANGDPRKGQLTDSVLRLKDREPKIELLEGLTVAQHRKGIFEGYLKAHKGGKIISGAGGFTNTLRLKHRAPIVNLPGVGAEWGKEIRGCLIAPEGHSMVGSDVSSLEDCTKRHYMQPLDQDYVDQMSEEGFDPHMKLLVIAGKITEDDYEFYTNYKKTRK